MMWLLHCLLFIGDLLFWPLCGVVSLRGICRGGPVGRDQLGVPPPAADHAHVQHCHRDVVPGEQHDQPGHVRGVPHQHAGLDDPLAGAQQGQGATAGLHSGQRGHGHHDRHEYCAVLSAAQERLFEEQHSGDEERQGDVKETIHTHTLCCTWTPWGTENECPSVSDWSQNQSETEGHFYFHPYTDHK